MRALIIAAALLVVGLIVSYTIFQRVVSYAHPEGGAPTDPLVLTGDAPATTRLDYRGSSLAYAGNLAVLRLVGPTREIGAAQGRLLPDAIAEISESLAPCVDAALPAGGWLSRQTRGLRLRWRLRLLDDGVPGHQLIEIAGVLRGAGRWDDDVDYEEFVRQQAVLDVGVAAPWSSGASLRTVARTLSFVAPIRDTSGDRLLIGRTVGLPGAGDGGDAAARHVTVSFVRAEGVLPFAAVGWPGLIGTLSGINAEGIAVMVHPAHTSEVRLARAAQPIALLARDVLENARNLAEAIQVLEHGSPLGAAAFLVVDGNTREWAVVERSPTRTAVLRGPEAAVVTDLLAGEPFSDDAENDRAARTRPDRARAQRVRRLLRDTPPRSPDDAAALLRDHRGTGGGIEGGTGGGASGAGAGGGAGGALLPPGHRAAVFDDAAIHVALFDASGMVLWVADGPSADASFRAFDLRHELRGDGARPAPPPDLAAHAGEPLPTEPVRQARRHLRQARRAWQDGDAALAHELVERALARVPTLPEALVLAGDISRRRGDVDAARRHYQRYLAMEPDDLEASQEVRAVLDNL